MGDAGAFSWTPPSLRDARAAKTKDLQVKCAQESAGSVSKHAVELLQVPLSDQSTTSSAVPGLEPSALLSTPPSSGTSVRRRASSSDLDLSVRSAFTGSSPEVRNCAEQSRRCGQSRSRGSTSRTCRSSSRAGSGHANNAPQQECGRQVEPEGVSQDRASRSASSGKPFLRKGSHAARSLPPRSSPPQARPVMTVSVVPGTRKLQPREAFKQAAATLTTACSARAVAASTSSETPEKLTKPLPEASQGPSRQLGSPHHANQCNTPKCPARHQKRCSEAVHQDGNHGRPRHATSPQRCSVPQQRRSTPQRTPQRRRLRLGIACGAGVQPLGQCDISRDDPCSSPVLVEDVEEVANAGFEKAPEADAPSQLRLLDVQIERFRRDSEALERLQAQAEMTERELVYEREELKREIEAERAALRAELDSERETLRRERHWLDQEVERQRLTIASERLEMRERIGNLETQLGSKEQQWKDSADNLRRQVEELAKKNRELSEGLQNPAATAACMPIRPCAKQDSPITRETSGPNAVGDGAIINAVADAKGGVGCNGLSTLKVPPLPELTLSPEHVDSSIDVSCIGAAWEPTPSLQDSISAEGIVVSEVSRRGRAERVFSDGRREVVFANGLRKVEWTDGRTSVLFQNGDLKETYADGTVVYRYHSTQAVQTTLPDGTNVYCFPGGQVERHFSDGSKEIEFANGAWKHIAADGSEEVSWCGS